MTPSIEDRLAGAQGVMFDIDGCLVLADGPGGHGGTALPGAKELIDFVRSSGRQLVVFTNASGQTPSAIAAALRGNGLDVADHETLTPAVVAAELILARYQDRSVLAFGGDGLVDVLLAHGVRLVDADDSDAAAAVVIGWDTTFVKEKVDAAGHALAAGADLLVTSDARRFASRSQPTYGVSGFIAAGLTHISRRPYEVVGKPSAAAMSVILERLGVDADRVVVVGDDLDLEIRMARAGGATGVLVTTGISAADDAAAAADVKRPDLVVSDLPALLSMWHRADREAEGTTA